MRISALPVRHTYTKGHVHPKLAVENIPIYMEGADWTIGKVNTLCWKEISGKQLVQLQCTCHTIQE